MLKWMILSTTLITGFPTGNHNADTSELFLIQNRFRFNLQPLPSSFKTQIDIWHVFNLIRIVGAVLGWVFISFETRSYQFNPHEYKGITPPFVLVLTFLL